jgi:hypothetical protein
MTLNILEYPLVDGYLHNWLVAGPFQQSPVGKSDNLLAAASWLTEAQPVLAATPVDRESLTYQGLPATWAYYRGQGDHLVNLTTDCPLPQAICFLGYAQIQSPTAQTANATFAHTGFAEVWVNGQAAYRSAELGPRPLRRQQFPLSLQAGANAILFRIADLGLGPRALQLTLRLTDLTDPAVLVCLPTRAEQPARQQRLERLLDFASLEDVVNHRGAHFNLRWADDLDDDLVYAYQIQDAQGRIYVDGKSDTQLARTVDVGQEYRLNERPYWLVLKAVDVEYYEQNLRYQRSLPIHVLDTAYAASPYGAFAQRQQEALADAARREGLLYAQMARMKLGRWDEVAPKALLAAAERVGRGEVTGESDLLGLLGMAFAFGEQAAFPAGVLNAVQTAATSANYTTAMRDEGAEITQLAGELLAGQRYPEAVFVQSGQTGAWHRQQSEAALQAWLQRRAQRGYAAWNSNSIFADIVTALAHLVTWAESEAVAQLALALLDKTLFLMAVNSFKGAYGASHGATNAAMLKSAQLEATSGLMSMLWGTGVFNHHIAATVSLACSNYEFPLFIGDIANDLTRTMWGRERHAVGDGEVNLAAYRTPDYLLASAQDYRPGQRGRHEHLWQATFGPDAVVFTTHPACISEHPANQPGFWLGNAVLPRLAQWKDLLVAVYALPADDLLGFTHAYFPIYAFEEYAIDEYWAFARVGDGYLALTAANGLEWVKHAPDGYRELRSYGAQNIWLCQMGRAAQDGTFAQFQEQVRAMRLDWGDGSVTCETLRGEHLSFGWQGPLTVNGQEQALAGFKHVENPYCTAEFPASSMEIEFQGTAMRLSLD